MKSKQKFSMYLGMFMGLFLLLASSCEKDDNIDPSSDNTNGKTTAIFNHAITYDTMTDQNGNVYKTVTIGTQTWMAENLRTTKYNDGATISKVTDNNKWEGLSAGAYCNYNNTNSIEDIASYGRLYNWHAINTGKLAPIGWHVPTYNEWYTLISYLGGQDVAGGKLKETGTSHWGIPNSGATNETGFTALPGGDRLDFGGSFARIGDSGSWGSASEGSLGNNVFSYVMGSIGDGLYIYGSSKEAGMSVRCVRD